MRLIDADALYIEIMDRGIDGLQLDDLSEIQQVIADAPTVDTVPVVSCKDCYWWNGKKCDRGIAGDGNHFYCSLGQRKPKR